MLPIVVSVVENGTNHQLASVNFNTVFARANDGDAITARPSIILENLDELEMTIICR